GMNANDDDVAGRMKGDLINFCCGTKKRLPVFRGCRQRIQLLAPIWSDRPDLALPAAPGNGHSVTRGIERVYRPAPGMQKSFVDRYLCVLAPVRCSPNV